MPHRYMDIAFTPNVRDIQTNRGSREGYGRVEQSESDFNATLGPREGEFIAARDSFYVASVSESGWPYVQHRGGPPGFVRVLDANTLAVPDFRGNRQYVSQGNLVGNNRVSIIMMDYPNRRRLKLFGRVTVVGGKKPEGDDAMKQFELPSDSHYAAQIEQGWIIHVAAFDWNCPQHITPRYTERERRHDD